MEHEFRTRKFSISSTSKNGKPSTLNDEERSVGLTIASETRGVMVYDLDLGIVPEVLVMSGVRFSETGQVPLLDSHDRQSVNSVIGSVRDLVVEGDEMAGRAVYSSVDSAREAFTKLSEGHLTDYSAGYRYQRNNESPRRPTGGYTGKRI